MVGPGFGLGENIKNQTRDYLSSRLESRWPARELQEHDARRELMS